MTINILPPAILFEQQQRKAPNFSNDKRTCTPQKNLSHLGNSDVDVRRCFADANLVSAVRFPSSSVLLHGLLDRDQLGARLPIERLGIGLALGFRCGALIDELAYFSFNVGDLLWCGVKHGARFIPYGCGQISDETCLFAFCSVTGCRNSLLSELNDNEGEHA